MNYEELLRTRGGHERYKTLAAYLHDDPTALSRPGFADQLLADILDSAAIAHAKRQFRKCYAPETIMVDKHGRLAPEGTECPQETGAEAFANYLAPEMSRQGAIDERTDIYSIGRLLLYLDSLAPLPTHIVNAAKTAANEIPEDRYDNIDDMRGALLWAKRKATAKRYTAIAAIAAAAIGLIAILSIDFLPVRYGSEYVKPNTKENADDFLDQGFDPKTELGTSPGDIDTTLYGDTAAMARDQIKQYEAKCEQIFRKRYTAEAERILSKIYNKEYMGNNEKKFMAGSLNMTNELLDAQKKIAEESQVSDIKSQQIAAGIIDEVTAKLKNK